MSRIWNKGGALTETIDLISTPLAPHPTLLRRGGGPAESRYNLSKISSQTAKNKRFSVIYFNFGSVGGPNDWDIDILCLGIFVVAQSVMKLKYSSVGGTVEDYSGTKRLFEPMIFEKSTGVSRNSMK